MLPQPKLAAPQLLELAEPHLMVSLWERALACALGACHYAPCCCLKDKLRSLLLGVHHVVNLLN